MFTRARARGDFAFDAEVAGVFDDMLVRSIPFYREQHELIRSLARSFWRPGWGVYDLGCSTGQALIGLAKALPDCNRLTGFDGSEAMIDSARENVRAEGMAERIDLRCVDLNSETPWLEDAGLVTACWTLQFIRSEARLRLLRHIWESLRAGGALIVCEKVVAPEPGLQSRFAQEYDAFKRGNGYSEEEIRNKEVALDGVLVPLTLQENDAMMREAGFGAVGVFFQWFNFAACLCLK